MDEFFLIKKEVIDEYKKSPVTLTCNANDQNNIYEDSFIDVPKEKAEHYKKINNNWKVVNSK